MHLPKKKQKEPNPVSSDNSALMDAIMRKALEDVNGIFGDMVGAMAQVGTSAKAASSQVTVDDITVAMIHSGLAEPATYLMRNDLIERMAAMRSQSVHGSMDSNRAHVPHRNARNNVESGAGKLVSLKVNGWEKSAGYRSGSNRQSITKTAWMRKTNTSESCGQT